MSHSLIRILSRIASLPPTEILRKISKKIQTQVQRRKARHSRTYLPDINGFDIKCFTRSFPARISAASANRVISSAQKTLNHQFNILGSGWVVSTCEHNTNPVCSCTTQKHTMSYENIAESQRIRSLITPEYVPIDWHCDFISGYRWCPVQHYSQVKFGHIPGIEIKVPWELARMQHLPALAIAYGITSKNESHSYCESMPESYVTEFQNQVLDFVASNPPAFGVNWACAMEVGIRIINMLIAYDIFRSHDIVFTKEFMSIFARSVREHAAHIMNNLEIAHDFRGNHYLSDIAGVVFSCAYSDEFPNRKEWLSFCLSEFQTEIISQFFDDGMNFEASVPYHYLSSEIVIFTLALMTNLEEHDGHALKREALSRVEAIGKSFELLEHPDGTMPQIGDNDSGRLVKFTPAYISLQNEASDCGTALEVEDSLNRPEVRDAFNSFFLDDHIPTTLEGEFVGCLLSNSRQYSNVSAANHGTKSPPLKGRGLLQGISSYGFPDFGLYIFRSESLYLNIRCGPYGQNGRGGHAHNDQLSFELSAFGKRIIVDSGTYCYTSFPETRNMFRSTGMHNTLQPIGMEQSPIVPGTGELFRLKDNAHSKEQFISDTEFQGVHYGFGAAHTRRIVITENAIQIRDELNRPERKNILLHLAPGLEPCLESEEVTLRLKEGLITRISAKTQGNWSIADSWYSPSYGAKIKTKKIVFASNEQIIDWAIQFGNNDTKN